MHEKWRLPLWAAAAAKDMEFAATQWSANPFVKEGRAFFDKLRKSPKAAAFGFFFFYSFILLCCRRG